MFVSILYWIFAALVFFSELVLWYSAGRLTWLIAVERLPKLSIALGILTSILTIALWAHFMAPKADQRLPVTARALIAGAASLLIGWALYRMNDRTFGLIMLVPVTIITVAGQIILELYQPQ